MYFKITKTGDKKYTDMGMINVSADFFLEPGDEGYEKYLAECSVQIRVVPKDGYKGEKDSRGRALDQEEYKRWVDTFPAEDRLNAFYNHSIQFEADATEEEKLFCFEWALALAHRNYLKNGLGGVEVFNQPFGYMGRKVFYARAKTIPEKSRTGIEKSAMLKCKAAVEKAATLKDFDFTKTKNATLYSVRK